MHGDLHGDFRPCTGVLSLLWPERLLTPVPLATSSQVGRGVRMGVGCGETSGLVPTRAGWEPGQARKEPPALPPAPLGAARGPRRPEQSAPCAPGPAPAHARRPRRRHERRRSRAGRQECGTGSRTEAAQDGAGPRAAGGLRGALARRADAPGPGPASRARGIAAMAKERRRAVLELLQRPGNARCADCGAPGRWGPGGRTRGGCGAGWVPGRDGCGSAPVRGRDGCGLGWGPAWMLPPPPAKRAVAAPAWPGGGGAGPECTCTKPDVASQRPRGLRLCRLPSPPPPPGCVSHCHPRTSAATLRNLGSAEKEEIAGQAATGRERASLPPRASVRGCGGSTWLPAT